MKYRLWQCDDGTFDIVDESAPDMSDDGETYHGPCVVFQNLPESAARAVVECEELRELLGRTKEIVWSYAQQHKGDGTLAHDIAMELYREFVTRSITSR